MHVTIQQLETWLGESESERLEFKQASKDYDSKKLARYCAALANEGGGHVVLGVSDRKPHRITGSQAFADLGKEKLKLVERLHLRVDAASIDHSEGRVVVFEVPPRPLGVPIAFEGAYWMRSGESLVPMTQDRLKAIFAEAGPDFSAEICPDAGLDALDPEAVGKFRDLWQKHSGNTTLAERSTEQLLVDAELLVDGGITYAALILLGERRALGRHLALAEVIFEYRSSEASIDHNQRQEFREGFFLFRDALWGLINLRNDLHFYQEGMVRTSLPSFNEMAVREAILNAVSHREYRSEGSIFVRQFPRKIEIESPGGFPSGVDSENLLWKQRPRNRRIAETFQRCGLVERAGQGANRIFETSILEGKLPPDFRGTDAYQVLLILDGEMRDALFVRFLARAREETGDLSTNDLVVLDAVHRRATIPRHLADRVDSLCERGVLEAGAEGVALSPRIYELLGKNGLREQKPVSLLAATGMPKYKLAAILFTDVGAYSGALNGNEAGILSLLEEHNRLLRAAVDRHDGRVVKTMGDGFMVEFPSATAAVSCALDAQRAFARHNTAAGEDRQILVRMGVHAGEVAVRPDEDLLGLTVNVAARLEQEAPIGRVCVSDPVLGMVRHKVSAAVEPLGVRELKGVGPAELYALSPADEWSE